MNPADRLLAAVSTRDLDGIAYAIKSGATPEDIQGAYMAASTKGDVSAIETLLKHGGGVMPTQNVMWNACRLGFVEVIKLLVANGLEFGKAERDLCKCNNHYSIVHMLLPPEAKVVYVVIACWIDYENNEDDVLAVFTSKEKALECAKEHAKCYQKTEYNICVESIVMDEMPKAYMSGSYDHTKYPEMYGCEVIDCTGA